MALIDWNTFMKFKILETMDMYEGKRKYYSICRL